MHVRFQPAAADARAGTAWTVRLERRQRGFFLRTVIDVGADLVWNPPLSVAIAVKVYVPWRLIVQLSWYGAERAVPSSVVPA